MDPLMIAGAGFFFAGMLTFMAVLFGSGGANKSEQFRVIREVWRGDRGAKRRQALRLGLMGVAIGAVLLFAGVSRGDAKRAERCRAYCKARGYEIGAIGPATEKVRNKPAFVACKCTGSGKPGLEVRADDLVE